MSSGLFMKKYMLCIGLFLCSPCFSCFAFPVMDSGSQYRDSVYRRVLEEGVLTLSCHFSYALNSAEINPALGDNLQELKRLDAFVRAAVSDTALYVKRVGLSGFSSIEGPYAVNERLARDRARSFRDHLEAGYSLSESVPVDISWVAEDWGGLYTMLLDVQFSGREEVLRLIEEVDVFRGREGQLMRVRGGKVYKWLLSDYFPRLRRVEIRVEYDLQRMLQDVYHRELSGVEFERALEEERDRLREEVRWELEESLPRIDTVVAYTGGALEILGLGEIYSITHTEDNRLCHLCYPEWGVKTNLLHLGGFVRGKYTTPLLNLSVERFLARGFSVEAAVEYSNRTYNKGREFQGLTGYRVEPRFGWRHSRSFSCVYVGAYGQTGDFNLHTLRTDSGGETYRHTGTYYEAGLSVGCYIPLSLHWGFDIGVRGGYRHSKGRVYEQEDGNRYLLYDRISRSLRLSSVSLSLSYRWGYK